MTKTFKIPHSDRDYVIEKTGDKEYCLVDKITGIVMFQRCSKKKDVMSEALIFAPKLHRMYLKTCYFSIDGRLKYLESLDDDEIKLARIKE